MRDKMKKHAMKDDYETAVLDDMEAEAAYERQKEAWRKVPNAAPAPRAKPGAVEASPNVVHVDDGTFDAYKKVLDGGDQAKRAALANELASLPPKGQAEPYSELHSRLPPAFVDGAVDVTDSLGNEVSPPPAEKKTATRQEMRQIRKRVEEKRKDGIDCDTDDELATVGLKRDEEASKPRAKPAKAPADKQGGTTQSTVAKPTATAAASARNGAAATRPAVVASTPAAASAASPRKASTKPVKEKSKSGKKSQDCMVM